ncbi:glycoside hydrolase family 19 protein [Neorhizobium sp. T786]|uniref:glycoside hydrolase family 19 protein n=1 Tax=Pseudorhizobium xiangyangii TaxID=2883104 RepID=UPI001CFF9F4A|nr:glycoside hydrolase family 19 protein [Neorhizobium xiangyangii]MCB5201870.1 glycoside hydrolase family 19 protein [Neorhizobium xiangyangii]
MNVPITAQQLRLAAKGKVNEANMNAVLDALSKYGQRFGLDKPHRLSQFLAQVMHESGDFKYDKEIWGPTAAQKRYEGRKDLGNTAAGDGKRFMGRSAIQITGRANYAEFTRWCRAFAKTAPDFTKEPEKVNTDPWEGLGPVWYWDTRNLNKWADQGDIETVTKRINGGLNGYDDRVNRYCRISLVLLGYGPKDVGLFQKANGLDDDGIPGPKTRSCLHTALVALVPGEAKKPEVKAAPVTEETIVETTVTVPVDRPVVPATVEKEVRQKTGWGAWLTTALGIVGGFGTWLASAEPQLVIILVGSGLLCAGLILFGGEWIVRRVKSIRRELEA